VSKEKSAPAARQAIATAAELAVIDALFVWPKFVRKDFKSTCDVCWSPKMNGRVYVYTRERIRLWEWLEVDPGILRYNVAVSLLQVVTHMGEAARSSPDAISESIDRQIVIHLISGARLDAVRKDDKPHPELAPIVAPRRVNWETCATQLGGVVKLWHLDELSRDADVRIELNRLARFGARRNRIADQRLADDIHSQLLGEKWLTIGHVLALHSKRDFNDVLAVIADLVRCGQAFVDVHSACLSLDSRLSARRETLQ